MQKRSPVAVVVFLSVSLPVTGSALENNPCRHDTSLACQRAKAIESALYCSGCMPLGDLMKIELRWDTTNDLDLHVWRPPGRTETKRVRVGWDNDETEPKAWYSCDYQGNKRGRKKCRTKGERVNIARSAFVYGAEEDRTYCVGVQTYDGGTPDFTLSLSPEAASALSCKPLTPPGTGRLSAAEKSALDDGPFDANICGGPFPSGVGTSVADRPWLALLVFRAPEPATQIALDELTVVRGLECLDEKTGTPVPLGSTE